MSLHVVPVTTRTHGCPIESGMTVHLSPPVIPVKTGIHGCPVKQGSLGPGISACAAQGQPGVFTQRVEVDLGKALLGQPHVIGRGAEVG